MDIHYEWRSTSRVYTKPQSGCSVTGLYHFELSFRSVSVFRLFVPFRHNFNVVPLRLRLLLDRRLAPGGGASVEEQRCDTDCRLEKIASRSKRKEWCGSIATLNAQVKRYIRGSTCQGQQPCLSLPVGARPRARCSANRTIRVVGRSQRFVSSRP